MNFNNQSSANLKQLRLQVPTTYLNSFTEAMIQLREMYPTIIEEEAKHIIIEEKK